MQSYLQSAFFQALGYAIANSLWQVALMWLIAIAIKNIAKLSSAGSYLIGIIAQFAGFVWFLFTLHYYYQKCEEALSLVPSGTLNDHAYVLEPTIKNFSSAVLYITIKGEQFLPYLSFAYLTVLFFLIIRLTRAFYCTQKIRSQGLQKPNVEWRLFVRRTAAYLGIKKDVKIYFSDLIKSPVTLGFLKPMILVPVATINHLTTDQLEALLLHELAHIKRADYLVNIIQAIVEIILFFNPFMQLLSHLIKKERENSCDDWVLQFQYNPAMYAEALLRIACIPANTNFAMNATGNKHDLLSRVKRMLNQQEKSYSYRNQVFALLLVTVMLSTVAWINPVTKFNSSSTRLVESQKDVLLEPLALSADNPLFSPMYFFSKPIQQELDNVINKAGDHAKRFTSIPGKPASNILATVSPVVLEKLQDLKEMDTNVSRALTTAQKALSKLNLPDLALDKKPSLSVDSDYFSLMAKAALSKILNQSDWKQVNGELNKAKDAMLSAAKEDLVLATNSGKLSDALKNTANELQQLQTNKYISVQGLLKNLQEDIKQKTELRKIEESQNNIREKIKEEKKNRQSQRQPGKPKTSIKTYSDIEEQNAYSAITPSSYNSDITNSSDVYLPVAFNDFNYTFNYIDSNNTPQSAIIILKHDPSNDTSHTKHITVDITGNNGLHRSYEFTVEVYQ